MHIPPNTYTSFISTQLPPCPTHSQPKEGQAPGTPHLCMPSPPHQPEAPCSRHPPSPTPRNGSYLLEGVLQFHSLVGGVHRHLVETARGCQCPGKTLSLPLPHHPQQAQKHSGDRGSTLPPWLSSVASGESYPKSQMGAGLVLKPRGQQASHELCSLHTQPGQVSPSSPG